MQRREFFAWCLSGCVTGGALLSSRARAQEEAGRVKLQSGSAAQPNETQRLPRPEVGNIDKELPKELDDLLIQWESRSGKITKMQGPFHRYVYDFVFDVEKRAEGEFWYEAPDKGRMDFVPVKIANSKKTRKVGPDGQEHLLDPKPDEQQRWICTGTDIFIIFDDKKLFEQAEIPPHLQGANVVNGPLPFLFGLKAQQAKERYRLDLGKQHNPDGRRIPGAPPRLHIVAKPSLEMDAREWSVAEVFLNPTTFDPTAIRLMNPTNTRETVYVFPSTKLSPIWVRNPFNHDPPRGYTRGGNAQAPKDEGQQGRSSVVPAGGRKPAGPAASMKPMR